jgi:lipoyl(octanoyl) transferase
MRRSSDAPLPSSLTPDEAQPGRLIDVRRLGVVTYAEALALQGDLVDARRMGAIGDTLLLLEHPPVITLGARNRVGPDHVLASREELQVLGIEVAEAGRGGDVTYHGPGQLVGYPILDLRPDRCDVHQYVRDLEEVLIHALSAFGVVGRRVSGWSGVWVGPPGREEKIAAIGVRFSRWITSHGFALNVSTDLRPFGHIVPCGITGRGVTSMERLLGHQTDMAAVQDAVCSSMRHIFR